MLRWIDDEESTLTSTATTAGVGFRSDRGPILIAIMVTTGLVAIDATILATAVPTIVGELGGFSSFPWLFSIYLLTQAVSVPIYSKLADTVGRKPVVLLGIALFLTGSVLCGFAWSMPALIAFRAVQGLGAGRRAADGHHDRRRHLHGRRAGQGAGVHRERLGDLVGGRSDARRHLLRVRQLAVDLLRQHPAVHRRRVAARPVPARDRRAQAAPHRLGRRRRCSPCR